MLGTLIKALVLTAFVLAITGGIGLFIMAGVASTHDVKSIPIPPGSSLAVIAAQWDYADAFRRPMEFNSYRDLHQMMENISVKGDGEIHRTATEIVYEGTVPGMQYQVAYILDRSGFPPAIELVTAYRFKSDKGKYLWKVYRPIHRCLAPYLLDRLGERAPS
ncbi:MAG TPA: hypothetical protein VF247_01710 [Candidatus Krumholzibacteria bacterium]